MRCTLPRRCRRFGHCVFALPLFFSVTLWAQDAPTLLQRIEALERHEAEMKAMEFQTLSMQKQERQIESLRGITVSASLVNVASQVNDAGAATNQQGAYANYRGDVSVTLPGGQSGNVEGKIFTHVSFGQGLGVQTQPTYANTINSTNFQAHGNTQSTLPADDSFAVLAQAWYQLHAPLASPGNATEQPREHWQVSFGKMDPFVFFDQNLAADDEKQQFLNSVFVHNPLLDSGGDMGSDAYGFMPGLVMQYLNDRQKGGKEGGAWGVEWSLTLGAFASGAAANYGGELGSPMLIAQWSQAWRAESLPGHARLYAWSNGRAQNLSGQPQRHSGFGLSLDQRVEDSWLLFARYGQRTEGEGKFDWAATLGLEIRGDFWGRSADALGLALGALHTDPRFAAVSQTLDANGDGQADYGWQARGYERDTEIYYRWHINSVFHLSLHGQRIDNPAGNNNAAAIEVASLRARIGF